MCKPRDPPIQVVVVGAGPAGLLATINLLRRNERSSKKYRVTLIDPFPDFGAYSEEELKRHRSWMIGLSTHGLTAIRKVPGLYEDYVSEVGVKPTCNSIHIGRKEFKISADDTGEGYVVDRNFICAALARFLRDKYSKSGNLEALYESKVLYVDGENKRVLTRSATDASAKEYYVEYDFLIGCDGIRSSVRDAIVKNHRDFECEVGDIFCKFKAVHIARPKSIQSNEVHVMPNGMHNMNGIALPETGDKLNVSFGHFNNNSIHDALNSNDPKIVAAYVKDHFKAFELDDYDDFAQQWVDQNWSTTGQVHCNFYHSLKLNALIMGDAAHATSPSIGMGMNTALADAAALDDIMDKYNDDLDQILPAFSQERVKEGNALTWLAIHAYSMDVTQNIMMQIRSGTRMFLNKLFPTLVMEEPLNMVAKGKKLSEAYDAMVQLGRIKQVRHVNDNIRQDYFERTTGMVTHEPSKWPSTLMFISAAVVSISLAGILGKKYTR